MRVLIGYKPMVYCAGKLIENLKLFYKSRFVIYKLSSCSPNIPRGLSRGRCNRYFWDIRLKIDRLPNFLMLFQLVLTNCFKSELFLCLLKVDHLINQCKRPIVWHKSRAIMAALDDFYMYLGPSWFSCLPTKPGHQCSSVFKVGYSPPPW